MTSNSIARLKITLDEVKRKRGHEALGALG